MNRILTAITPVRVAWAAVALVVGVWSGAAAAGVPDVKAPHQCTVMANAADKLHIDYVNQVYTIHNRATRGLSEFDKYERESQRLWDAIDAGKAGYSEAKAACLGGAR